MTVSPSLAVTHGLELATVAGGCFWGVEHIYKKYLGSKIRGIVVGYTNGHTQNPGYRQVCSGSTNHAEAVQILFDPKVISYEHIIEFFLRTHNPTESNRQGPDVGSQYRSGIYTHSPEQTEKAKSVVKECQRLFEKPIVTEIEPISNWWDAEDYHQKYLQNNPGGYECPTHYLRGTFGEWLTPGVQGTAQPKA